MEKNSCHIERGGGTVVELLLSSANLTLIKHTTRVMSDSYRSYAQFNRYPCPYPEPQEAQKACLRMGYLPAMCDDLQLACSQVQTAFHSTWRNPFINHDPLMQLCAEVASGSSSVIFDACPISSIEPFGAFVTPSNRRYPIF